MKNILVVMNMQNGLVNTNEKVALSQKIIELSQKHIEYLEDLGMVWKAKTGPKVSSDMDVKYRFLKQYAYIHGSLANVRIEDDMLCMDDYVPFGTIL